MFSSETSVSRRVQDWVGARKLLRLAVDLNCYLFELRLFLGYLAEAGVPSSYALLWLVLAQVCYRAYPAALSRSGPCLGDVVRGLRLKYRLLVALLYYWLELGRWCAFPQEQDETGPRILAFRAARGMSFLLAVLNWVTAFNLQCLELKQNKIVGWDPLGLAGASGVLCATLFKQALRAMAGSGPSLCGCYFLEASLAALSIGAFGAAADAVLVIVWCVLGFRRGFAGL